jgi:hypothetical protein
MHWRPPFAPNPAYDAGMDFTVTLVVLGFLAGIGPWQELRHPGMSEAQCKALVKEIERPLVRAYCFVEGRPEPVWSSPPRVDPAPVCADCRTIREMIQADGYAAG